MHYKNANLIVRDCSFDSDTEIAKVFKNSYVPEATLKFVKLSQLKRSENAASNTESREKSLLCSFSENRNRLPRNVKEVT